MADGFPSSQHFRRHLSAETADRLRRAYAVAYSGDFKVVLGLHDQAVRTYNLRFDPEERTDLGSSEDRAAAQALAAARDAARRIAAARLGRVDPRLEAQLESWGY